MLIKHALLSSAVALVGINPAMAQQAAQADAANAERATSSEIAEIVVTAQKKSERLSDVPMSISAATGEELRSRGISTTADLERVVPGFTFQDNNGIPLFAIRGVGFFDQSIGGTPTVSVYVDQAPVPFSIETDGVGLDLERVEVLKGPQGTLFGDNSTGGAINYIAAKPTQTLSAGQSVDYGRFNTINLEGFVSGPITKTLTARVAARTESGDGWQRSTTRNDLLGKRSVQMGRIIVDWTPSDRLKVEASVNGWQNNSDSKAYQFAGFAPTTPAPMGYPEATIALANYPLAPNDPQAADWDPNQKLKRDDDFVQGTMRVDWNVSDALAITSITSYSRFRRDTVSDFDGTSFNNFRQHELGRLESTSEELRASGKVGSLSYMLGVNYADQSTYQEAIGSTIASNSGLGPFRWTAFTQLTNQSIKTKAVFGSVDYAVSGSILLHGSARYSKQDRDFTGCLKDAGDGAIAAAFGIVLSAAHAPLAPGSCVTVLANGTSGLARSSLDQDNVSWRAGVDFKPSPGTLFYLNVSRGYKAGAYANLPFVLESQTAAVPQESVLAYEAGFKTSLLNRRVQIDGAVFHYDYSDKQLVGFVAIPPFGNLPALVSIPKSRVDGVELNALINPARGLKINLGGTFVASKVVTNFLSFDPFGRQIDLKDARFPNTPRWQIKGDVEQAFPLSGGLDGFVGGDMSYRSASQAAFGETNAFVLPAYAIFGLRAGIKTDHWSAQVWGRNVGNKYYLTNVTHVVDTVARSGGMPATYGVTLSYRM